MKIISLSAFVFIFHSFASASTCVEKDLKNCVGVSAHREFLYWTPVCVMQAECDSYCGTMKFDKVMTTFYCGFKSIKGDDYTCMSASKCETDDSVVKNSEDVKKLTKYPVSAGAGLNLPKDPRRGAK